MLTRRLAPRLELISALMRFIYDRGYRGISYAPVTLHYRKRHARRVVFSVDFMLVNYWFKLVPALAPRVVSKGCDMIVTARATSVPTHPNSTAGYQAMFSSMNHAISVLHSQHEVAPNNETLLNASFVATMPHTCSPRTTLVVLSIDSLENKRTQTAAKSFVSP